jgi:hypothetical protein
VVLVAWALGLLVWIVLVAEPGRLSTRWMLGLAVESLPPLALYVFAIFAGRFPVRSLPLERSGPRSLLGAHGLAALTVSALWVSLARLWVGLLRKWEAFGEAAPRLEQNTAPLLVFAALGYLLAVAVHYLVVAARQARAAEVHAARVAALAREAELRALRSQLSPHFLFNSLNAVAALVSADPEAARALCQRLAEFLRQTLRLGSRDQVTLAEELELARHLVAIERVRFGTRLRWREAISDDVARRQTALRVPPLILLPLLENAMTHGVSQRLEGGEVLLEISARDGQLAIAIENVLDDEAPRRQGVGVGLENVRQRLDKLYGTAGALETERRADRFRVRLTLPWELV